MAAAKMARENAGLSLQPTALVHKAWLRLGGDEQPTWENRAHFFGAAAEAVLLSQASPGYQADRDLTVRALPERIAGRLDQATGRPPLVEASIRQTLGSV